MLLTSNQFSKVVSSLSSKTSKDINIFAPILEGFNASNFKIQQKIEWHGLIVNLHLQSSDFLSEIKSYFPQDWLSVNNLNSPSIDIFIYDDVEAKVPREFWVDEDSTCHLYHDPNSEWACQRDFFAQKSENQIIAICKNNVSDGFFNLMRWVLPRFWLSNNQFLFHSCCVLDNKNQAYLCLGPSGAGKSTIAKFLPNTQVLGDDMNLVTIGDDGQVWVTPSLLGQTYESSKLFGHNFPLKQIFWLSKSEENKVVSNKDLSLRLKICMSLVNIFWDHLGQEDILTIQKLITSLSKKYDIKELQFSLDKGVWDYVFSEN